MIFNAITLGGSGGGNLTITAPSGVTVLAENETLNKTYKRTANAEGIAIFKGLAGGTWQLHITDGEQTSEPIPIIIKTDYETVISFNN